MPVAFQDNDAIMARREATIKAEREMARQANRDWQDRLKADYPLMAQQNLPKGA